MLTTLWASRSGLNANQEKMDVISSNITNVNTIGYKKLQVGFEDLLSASLDEKGNPLNDKNASIGTGVKTTAATRCNAQGSLLTTEQNTDIAIDGDGYFRVIGADGTSYYTRVGEFSLDLAGRMVDKQGNILDIQYENGYSAENARLTSSNFSVNKNGEIYMTENTNSVKIGEIPLYTAVGEDAFVAVGDNLFKEMDGVLVYRSFDGNMYQGFLEGSNVDLSEEMSELIVTQRAFQLSSKAMTSADEMWGMINNLR